MDIGRVLTGIAAACVCLVAGASVESCSPAIESNEVWFDQLLSAPQITDEEAENLAQFAAQTLFNPGSGLPAIPESWREDTVPRILFISLSNGTSSSQVVRGSGQGFGEAVVEALEKAREWIERGHSPLWLKLDVVQDVSLLTDIDPGSSHELVRSLYGLAFDQPSGLAWLPEELVAYTLVNSEQELRFKNMEKVLIQRSAPLDHLQRLRESRRLSLFRFKTTSYFSDGKEPVRLYRGHRLFRKPTGDEMRLRALAGGQYLTRAVEKDGQFVYSYLPKTDEVADAYNILRHAGTLYSMLELYDVTGDAALLEAAGLALDSLLAAALPCELGGQSYICIVEDEEVKLGGNGLAAVALAKYIEVTGDREHLSDLIAWGQTLRALQFDSGEFIHKITYPEAENTGFVSEYYPGEALLALVRIYGQDPQEGWLDAAEKGAQYLINVRDQGLSVEELAHDHRLMGKDTEELQPLYSLLSFCIEHWWEFLAALALVGFISILFSHRIVGPIRRFENALIQKTEHPTEPVNCRVRSDDYFQEFSRNLDQFLNTHPAFGSPGDSDSSPQGEGTEIYEGSAEVST